jgi:hypothetical protein
MTAILQSSFETDVRSRLAVDAIELPDEDINSRFITNIAESYIIKRVPTFADITDESDSLFLESAVISYICYKLCPTMANRINVEVQNIDTKWKRGKVDWDALAQQFLSEMENLLSQIVSVEVTNLSSSHLLGGIANFQGTTGLSG